MLHLIESQEAAVRPDNVHHAFEVADFDAAMKALQEKGITIERTGVRHDGQRLLFMRDPDGNRVELCTPSGC
jgi:catechol 2,3-dioxygenase-like lactoylglutathione lyase family enzyme